jgi:hypothetical protein
VRQNGHHWAPMADRSASRLSTTRALTRLAWRDPENISERLTLYAAQRLAAPARDWAARVRQTRADTPLATVAEEVRAQSAAIARIDGAVAGTPFFIALAPGYIAYLVQEARMALRIAALYGRDPATLRTAGELLALRGMYRTPEAAEEALIAVRDAPPPDKPQARRPLRTWVRSVYRLLVFGGFLSPPKDKSARGDDGHSRLRTAIGIVVGTAIWVVTWVLPVTFMIAMAWGCETHTRRLGRRVVAFYDGEATTPEGAIAAADRRQDRGHDKRQILRTVALILSVAIPVGFVAYADHVRQSTGINWVGGLGALVAVSLVVATVVVATRR